MKLGQLSTRPFLRAALCCIPLAAAACDDEFKAEWVAHPDTVLLYSLSRPELIGKPSAYNIVDGITVAVENPGVTGTWDFAVIDQGNEMALMPAGGFTGLSSRAAVVTTNSSSLFEFEEAPSDTSLYKTTATPLRTGLVYVVRSRRESCGFGSGVRYGKLEALAIDRTAGTVQFRIIRNPYCNDRRLIPPDEN